MSHPEIIVPFALPPAEHARDLSRLLATECGTQGLALLLARASALQRSRHDDFARQLPHEDCLSKLHRHNPLIAQQRRLGVVLAAGYWFLLQPVHLHVASNHLVLTDYRQLALSDADARQLFAKAQLSCSAAGVELIYGDATHWFLRADAWAGFDTASPDAACGHNIEIWSPRGPNELAWRKLQNEIQMEWFIDPLQEQRQSRGEKAVNGLWLWSGTALPQTDAATLVVNPDVKEFIAKPHNCVLNQLESVALAGDWGAWAQGMAMLERDWFVPLCAAVKSGPLSRIELVLSNSNSVLRVRISRNGLRRFWRRANFNPLL